MRSYQFEHAVRILCRRRPFRLYTVEFMTGELLVIKHPEALAVRSRFATLTEPDGSRRYFDAHSVCQLFAGEVRR
jgi:hypothetical protein